MPSNRELIDSIHKIDSTVDTQGMSNATLASVLSALRAEHEPDVVQEQPAEQEQAPVIVRGVVAPGCAITTKRGVIVEGEDIDERDIAGGAESYGHLIAIGKIV